MESNQIAMIGVGVVVVGAIGFAVYKFTSNQSDKADDTVSPAVEPRMIINDPYAPYIVKIPVNNVVRPVLDIQAPQQSVQQMPTQATNSNPMYRKLVHHLLQNKEMPEVKIMQRFLNAAYKPQSNEKIKPLEENGRFNNATNLRMKAYMHPFTKGTSISTDYITLHTLRTTNEDLFDSIYNAGAIAALSGTVFGLPLFGL